MLAEPADIAGADQVVQASDRSCVTHVLDPFRAHHAPDRQLGLAIGPARRSRRPHGDAALVGARRLTCLPAVSAEHGRFRSREIAGRAKSRRVNRL